MPSSSPPPHHHPSPVVPAPRVLVLDDDPDIRSLMASALRHRGYDVAQVADGVHGVEYLDAATRLPALDLPHLVVADVRMPGLGGLDLLRVMRAANLTIPVLLVTAQPAPMLEERALLLGAAGVLAKPFTLDAFADAVATHLAPRLAPHASPPETAPRPRVVRVHRTDRAPRLDGARPGRAVGSFGQR